MTLLREADAAQPLAVIARPAGPKQSMARALRRGLLRLRLAMTGRPFGVIARPAGPKQSIARALRRGLPKWTRLVQWCEDATKAGDVAYRPLFVPEAEWRTSRFASFAEAAAMFKGRQP